MLMTTREICEELKIHPTTLYRWIKKYPDFPAVRLGGHWRFEMPALQRWINKHQSDAFLKDASDLALKKEDVNE